MAAAGDRDSAYGTVISMAPSHCQSTFVLQMVGMTAALSVTPGLAGAELGEYRVGYISQDGMRHQVSLADAQAVRFEVISPGAAVCRPEGAAASAGPVVVVHGRRSRRV